MLVCPQKLERWKLELKERKCTSSQVITSRKVARFAVARQGLVAAAKKAFRKTLRKAFWRASGPHMAGR